MSLKKPSRKQIRSLCAEAGPEDGVDPRDIVRGAGRKPVARKAYQLCGQVAQTLDLVFASQRDDVLRGLHVVGVEPAPDATRLLVTVGALPAESPDPGAVLARLEAAAGRLRTEVAAAITRKKAPLLTFRYAIPARCEADGA